MSQVLPALVSWLHNHEAIALWLEGIALVLIFIWDRLDNNQQHEQTLEQMKIMQRQADALINSERAWVFADIGQLPGDFAPTPNAVGVATMPIFFRNYGRTPARLVRLCLRACQVQTIDGLPAEPEYRQANIMDLVIPPNVNVNEGIAVAPASVSVPISDFVAVRQGASFLYVYGFVDYVDFGGVERQTRFCWRYNMPWGFNQVPEGFRIFANIPPAYLRST